MKNKIVIAALLCLLLLGLGGTALAEEYCPVCNGPIIYLDPDYEDETSHIIVGDCIDCNELVITFKEHYGGTATCTQKAVCSGCGGEYGQPLGHSWQTNNGTHSCTRSGCTVSETCSGTDDGDCTTALNCSTCGYTINSAQAAHDYTGAPATCTTPQTCARSGCETILEAARGHTAVIDAAVEPTCTQHGLTEGSHCAVCALELVPQLRVEAMGHIEARRDAVEPTCTEAGYTAGVDCAVCGDVLRAVETVPALGHWYGEWTPNGDGTHSAPCRREGCGHTGSAACAAARIPALTQDAGDVAFCPVCGAVSTGERLELVEGARACAVNGALPRGELVLRVGALADGRRVMSVAMEYAGALEQPLVEVEISVPAEACALWAPAPLTQSCALAEAWSLQLYAQDGALLEIACAAGEAALTFRIDFTPVEGEENAPVRLCLLPSETI